MGWERKKNLSQVNFDVGVSICVTICMTYMLTVGGLGIEIMVKGNIYPARLYNNVLL